VHDPFDREAFDGILPRAPGLRLLVDGSPDPQTRDLAFDLFCSFYKYFVKLLPSEQIAAECERHHELLGRALGLREHEKLRAWTRLKPAETALATEIVLDLLLREPVNDSPNPPHESAESEDTQETDTTESLDDVSTERLREVLRDAREDLEGAVELATYPASPSGDVRRSDPARVSRTFELVLSEGRYLIVRSRGETDEKLAAPPPAGTPRMNP